MILIETCWKLKWPFNYDDPDRGIYIKIPAQKRNYVYISIQT